MKGLLNLLVVLATLLNLTTGCGPRAGGITGQGLLLLGKALVARRISASRTGGTLASLGGGLQRNPGGSLLTGLVNLRDGGVAGGLVTDVGGLASRGGAPDVGAGLQAGSGGALLARLGQLAEGHLQSVGSSSVGIGSGSRTTISGQQLQQGSLHSGQMAAGYVMAAGATSSTASRFTTHFGGSSATNTLGANGSQGAGTLLGVVSRGGSTPGLGGINPGVGAVQRVGQTTHQMAQASLVTTGGVRDSATSIVAHPAGNTATNVLGVGASLPGGSPIAGVLSGSSRPGSSRVSSGSGVVAAVPGAVPVAGLMPGFGTTGTDGVGAPAFSRGSAIPMNPGQVVGQGLQQTRQMVSRGLVTASSVTSTMATGGMGTLGVNTVGNTMAADASQGSGVPFGDTPSGGPGSGVGAVVSGQGRDPGAEAALNGVGAVGGLQSGYGALASGGTLGVGPSAGNPVSGPEFLTGQGLGQGARQINQAYGGGVLSPRGAILQSATSTTAQMTGNSASALINTASILGGVPDGAAPGSGIAPGLRAPNSGQGFAGSVQQIGLVVGGGSVAPGGTGRNPVPNLGAQPGGSYLQNLQGTHSSVSTTSAMGTSSSGTSQLGMTGTSSGWNTRLGPASGAQQRSQTQSGGSVLSVISSSHSSSSYRAHMVGRQQTNSLNGLPTSPGEGVFASGVPSGSTGSVLSGANSGGGLLGAIISAGPGQASQGVPRTVGAGDFSAHSSSSTSSSISSGAISGTRTHGQLQQRRKMNSAAAAGIALGVLSGALTLSAVGAGIAGAMNSGGLGGGTRYSGCSATGCRSGCGRKRRSVPQSKVPVEDLNSISMDFNRLD